MSVAYSVGYACGLALVAVVPAAVLVLLVPRVRRRVTWPVLRPLLRLATGRRPGDISARIAELEMQQELLDGHPEPLAFILSRGTLSYQDAEQIKRKFLASAGRPPVVLPPTMPPEGALPRPRRR